MVFGVVVSVEDGDGFVDFEAGGSFEQDHPVIVIGQIEEEALDFPAGITLDIEAGGDDSGVVGDEAVAGVEVIDDVGEVFVMEGVG